jgi:hypothetical protein
MSKTRKAITPPNKLCIYDSDHRVPTLNFLDLFTKIAIKEKQLIEVDLSNEDDYLAIMSNKGRYLFSSKEKEPLVQKLSYSFRGTLAEWSFSIHNHA